MWGVAVWNGDLLCEVWIRTPPIVLSSNRFASRTNDLRNLRKSGLLAGLGLTTRSEREWIILLQNHRWSPTSLTHQVPRPCVSRVGACSHDHRPVENMPCMFYALVVHRARQPK